jgi:hypothetical protein
MKVKTICTSLQEIDFQIKETIKNEFQPTLAIVFASLKCDLPQLSKIIDAHDIDILGASSAGEIKDTDLTSSSITIMLLDIKKDYYQIQHTTADYASSVEVGKSIVNKAIFSNPAYVLVFSLAVNGEGLIEGITTASDGLPTIFGGMAGDDMAMRQTFTFTNNEIADNGVTVLVLDNDKIEVEGRALCGWQPIGLENTITKSKDNIIYQINNKPALEVVKSYCGEFAENKVGEDQVPLGSAQYPLQIIRDDSYVLRAAMHGIEEDGSILMAGAVKQGDRFRFSVAPGFEIIDETIEGFRDFSIQKPDADALLMFSCVARHISLGPMIKEEIEGVYDVWKKPMIGFFTYGEVGQHQDQISQYYNETCSLVLLREK